MVNGGLAVGGNGATTIVPYRNKLLSAVGMLKNGKTAISEITDGTSNTIAVLECAGRDERFVSQYAESLYYSNPNTTTTTPVRGLGPAGMPTVHFTASGDGLTRALLWGLSVSRTRPGMPTNVGVPWPTATISQGDQAGPNDEPFRSTPGGGHRSLR